MPTLAAIAAVSAAALSGCILLAVAGRRARPAAGALARGDAPPLALFFQPSIAPPGIRHLASPVCQVGDSEEALRDGEELTERDGNVGSE